MQLCPFAGESSLLPSLHCAFLELSPFALRASILALCLSGAVAFVLRVSICDLELLLCSVLRIVAHHPMCSFRFDDSLSSLFADSNCVHLVLLAAPSC